VPTTRSSTQRRTGARAAGPPTPGTNLAVVRGALSRDPEVRSLPSGDTVVAYDVTVAPTPSGRSESVPVAWFDPPASGLALTAGDEVVVVGRVRRRFFRSSGATASRTEVVAEGVVPARSRARVRAELARAVEVLDRGR
jgi:single-strand DNA-binding protein